MASLDLSDFAGDPEDALEDVDESCLCDVERHDLGCFDHYEGEA